VIHHVFLYEEIDALLQRVVIIWNQHWWLSELLDWRVHKGSLLLHILMTHHFLQMDIGERLIGCLFRLLGPFWGGFELALRSLQCLFLSCCTAVTLSLSIISVSWSFWI
jgi:hypothetical protein